jgi:hypothetical protein
MLQYIKHSNAQWQKHNNAQEDGAYAAPQTQPVQTQHELSELLTSTSGATAQSATSFGFVACSNTRVGIAT